MGKNKETNQGQEKPKGYIETKHLITPKGKIMQEFILAKKVRRK